MPVQDVLAAQFEIETFDRTAEIGQIGRPFLALFRPVLEGAFVQSSVQPVGMGRIVRILLCLQPVVMVQRQDNDVAHTVLAHQRFPPWQKRRGVWPEIGEQQTGQLLNGIRLQACLLHEWAVGALIRLLDAIAVNVEFPAVIGASQAILFGKSVIQGGVTVRATFRQEAEPALTVAEQHQVFAQEPDLLDRIVCVDFLCAGHRHPVPTH